MSYDLIDEIQVLRKQLDVSVKQLRKTGTEYAKAERDYKVLLRQECLRLRDEGMAVGMITLSVYGIPSVPRHDSRETWQKRFTKRIRNQLTRLSYN